MPELKRPLESSDSTSLVLAKKPRNELVQVTERSKALVESGPPRTSNMEAPIMLLSGHQGEIYTAKFHPEGNVLVSAGFDRQIFMWNVYGECENFHVINAAHGGAIVQLVYSEDGHNFYTASTDKTVGVFDSNTMQRIKRLKGHTLYVNSCSPARRGAPLIVSGSDDCTIRVWDQRYRASVVNMNATYQITAVSFGDSGEQVVSAGIDNLVKVWDTRKPERPIFEMSGHNDTITGMSLSPEGTHVLTNSMDNTLRTWDIRPFASQERCTKIFTGHQHNFEKNLLHCSWSPDGALVSAGSADRFVYIWDTNTRKIMYKLPGHLGSVNDVDFHRVEPIILSAASDKQIYLGEFDDSI
jgi:Prp8 binding protein